MQAKTLLLLLVGGTLAQSASGLADFSRYAPILERRPFSAAVVEVDPPAEEAVTVQAPPEFVQHLRLVALTESPAGVKAGFINMRESPPKSYYLYEGDRDDGILLVEADFDRERALLRKDGEQFWMMMGGGADAPAAAAPASGRSVIRSSGASREDAEPSPLSGESRPSGASSYAERRRKRLEEMRRRAEASRNLSEAEVEQRLREYQMRLIREGKTPLPIPITEEMDAQLVEEGILPPRE